MSVTMTIYRVHPDDADRLLTPSHDLDVDEWLDAREDIGDGVDLDKYWHAIHFLLTGTAGDLPDHPVGALMSGGRTIGRTEERRPERLLSPEAVHRLAAALRDVSWAGLSTRYDPGALEAAEIYPGYWTRNDIDHLPDVIERYDDLSRIATETEKSGGWLLVIHG